MGETISYTVTVTAQKAIDGIGPLIVKDELSPYIKYNGGPVTVTTSDSSKPYFEVDPIFDGRMMTVEANHYLLAAGDWLSITFEVEVLRNGAGDIVENTAVAIADKLTEPQTSNTTEVAVNAASKKIADSGSAPVNIGDEVTFKIVYANNTGDTADLTITDKIPAGMEYVRSTGGVYDQTENKVVWRFDGVAPERAAR